MKPIYYLLVTFLILLSCNPQEETSPPPKVESEKNQSDTPDPAKQSTVKEDPKINEVAQFLAGEEAAGHLSELNDSIFKSFQKNIESLWQRTNKKLPVIREWTESEMKEANTHGKTLFYPFSGADFLHADLFFPEYDNIIMMALEPVGEVPDLVKKSKDSSYFRYMENLDKSMYHILRLSFFRTVSMADDFQSELDGTLPVFFHFMARTGHDVLYQEKVAIMDDGQLTTDISKAKENTYIGNRYYIRKQGEERVRTVCYFAVNIQNSPYHSRGGFYAKGLKTRKDLVAYLEQSNIDATYLKSASYLMHRDTYSIIRNIILDHSSYILQDDSGIPLHFFDRDKWELTFYGNYKFPINMFSERHQEDLKEVYETEKIKALPFGIGYQYRKGTSNMMKAVRK